jgi:hypothetical protein
MLLRKRDACATPWNGDAMKKLWAGTILLLALSIPLLAQGQRLSPQDQQRFDSYYSRWVEYSQSNNRDQMFSMEKRMQDIYKHYGIPSDTPYSRVASSGADRARDRDRDRDYDRDRDHDRDAERRDFDRDRDHWRGRLSRGDQDRFDSYYSRWVQYRQSNNREQVESMEKRMWEIYEHNQIPRSVPFAAIASQGDRR